MSPGTSVCSVFDRECTWTALEPPEMYSTVLWGWGGGGFVPHKGGSSNVTVLKEKHLDFAW